MGAFDVLQDIDLAALSDAERRHLLGLVRKYQTARARHKLDYYDPFPKQLDFHDLGRDLAIRERALIAANQVGKALHSDEPVLTPTGWVAIGQLREGDAVMSVDGTVTRVLGVYPQGDQPLYRLTFDRGQTSLCTGDHMWQVNLPAPRYAGRLGHATRKSDRRPDRQAVVTTKMLREHYAQPSTPRMRVTIDACESMQFPRRALPVDPFGLGLVLAEGNLLDSFPNSYLFNDHESRLALLQGLVDANGFVSGGNISFDTPSKSLADAVMFLAQSFGGKAWQADRSARTTSKCDREARPTTYRVRFRLPQARYRRSLRKGERAARNASTCDAHVLHSVVEAGSGPAVCIAVEHPSRLFITRDFLPTHNTQAAAAEVAIHTTGRYPKWWEGRRLREANHWWVGGLSSLAVRDTAQKSLLGPPEDEGLWGTGWIPAHCIVDVKRATHGVRDSVDTLVIRHEPTGKTSSIKFKSYEQGRSKWQGPTLNGGVWLDEEPDDESLYTEALTRTNVGNLGISAMVLATFTPLLGMSAIVKRYMRTKVPGTAFVQMTLDDALHYTRAQREQIISSYPPHEREARAKGIPFMGSGLIFPFAESLYTEGVINIPRHWPRIAGMDFGFEHPTAAAWLAWDRDTDVIHVYDVHRVSREMPVVHAAAIKARGDWIPVAWPHDGENETAAGPALAAQYRAHQVNMLPHQASFPERTTAKGEVTSGGNSVEAGIVEMYDRLRTGRLKIAKHLEPLLEEMRTYHRKDGKIVKEVDDTICAVRYAMMMLRYAEMAPAHRPSILMPAHHVYDPMTGI